MWFVIATALAAVLSAAAEQVAHSPSRVQSNPRIRLLSDGERRDQPHQERSASYGGILVRHDVPPFTAPMVTRRSRLLGPYGIDRTDTRRAATRNRNADQSADEKQNRDAHQYDPIVWRHLKQQC